MSKTTSLTMSVKLPKGISAAKAKKAIRANYGCSLNQAVRNLIVDALPAK